jgi:bifunctional DNA-binding transcriptional regulator/antitoxin component of YhaV-PrlF toxin-antitoxin module
MVVVPIDERGRLTIPKEIGIRDTRAIIIPAGSFIVAIPLPREPHREAEGWLDTDKTRSELKALAEEAAMEDAAKRARRRRQA